MRTLGIDLPDDVITAVGEDKARSLALEALLVKLYDLGEISGGRAAEILGISRRAFLDILDDYGVSEFDEEMNISEEASRG